ncbi:putative addiction module antidote protein HigA [Lactobacillus helveticus DSM 20075 = CGMCC 1.1877]|nr:putative addiction module antidote protein HigA [Lactobacillus helveticus DSM 20075 = CGMCC 1.1877]KRL36979.1 xre family toxin-antitoxin system [Lactobacillus helveticus DSM 20075 = CGMCC 1.1877]
MKTIIKERGFIMLHRENKIKKYHVSSAADLIQETMEYYDITQTDLAERLGVSQKNISDILKRKRFINEILALRLEKVMGISSELLLTLDSHYKLEQAKVNNEITNNDKKNPLFLRRYDWVSA